MGLGSWIKRGLLAPVRALLPKSPWLRVLVYALPVVLLLALFAPALDVVLKLVDLVMRVVQPLLDTVVGRILLLLIAFTAGGAVAVWLLRNRVRDMRAEATLGRHLQATASLVGLDLRKSRDRFRKVARYRGPLPDRYPHVVQDANLKLARLCLDAGRTEEALRWLASVVEPGLPDELLRSLLQLRVRALRRQGDVLPGALRGEIEKAIERFPHDYHLLGELRDVAAAAGDPHELAAVQERVVKHAPPMALRRERQHLQQLLVAAGRAAITAGDHDACRKAAKKLASLDKDGPASGLLLGDLHAALGDHRRAIHAWGETRSPEGLDRIAELLSDRPGTLEPRELLQACPMQGTLLLVARELARGGESARAERAARLAAEALGPTPTVCAVLAEVLSLLGQGDKARLLREQAVTRLLTGAPRGTGGAA